MATQPYRQTPTLQDVLMGANPGEGQPPVYPAASGVPAGVDPSLYDQAFAPSDIGTRPEQDKPNRLAQVLMGLGDAGTVYASILGGKDVRTHNLQAYMDYLQGQKDSATNYDRLKASQESESKRSKARFLLDKGERDQIARQEEEGKAADKAAKIAEAQAKRDQEVADEANRQAFELQKQAKAQAFDKGEQAARFAHEEGMAKLENRLKGGDKTAEKDLDRFSAGAGIVGGIQAGLRAKDGTFTTKPLLERLASGESPEAIRREFEDEMTQEGIFGAARNLTREYMNERMIRAHRELQKKQDEQQPPLGP